jgi:hypothetical protein
MLQRIHPGRDRGCPARRMLGMHRHPAAHGMHRGHHPAQDIGRQHDVAGHPVPDHLGPAGPGRLRRRQVWQLRMVSAPPPPVEELAMLSDPRPGVHGPRNIGIPAKPAGRITGQARGPDLAYSQLKPVTETGLPTSKSTIIDSGSSVPIKVKVTNTTNHVGFFELLPSGSDISGGNTVTPKKLAP